MKQMRSATSRKTKSLYSKLCEQRLSLREHLAAVRSILSNERTLLAYFRTALTLFVAGVSFIRFFGWPVLEVLGYIFVFIGIIILILGVVTYTKMKKLIEREEMEVCNEEECGDTHEES